jgi:hypothetical protein
MEILARNLAKTALFIVLLFVSIRYIYSPLSLAPSWNQHYSFSLSEAFGFRDIELFDVAFGSSTSALISCLLYALLMSIYRRIHERMQR